MQKIFVPPSPTSLAPGGTQATGFNCRPGRRPLFTDLQKIVGYGGFGVAVTVASAAGTIAAYYSDLPAPTSHIGMLLGEACAILGAAVVWDAFKRLKEYESDTACRMRSHRMAVRFWRRQCDHWSEAAQVKIRREGIGEEAGMGRGVTYRSMPADVIDLTTWRRF